MTEFEAVYRRYFDDVYRYIRRLSGDGALAEEIASEAFFKAMRALDSFRGDCDIRVWLCQIAKNCYYTHLQKSGRMDSLEELDAGRPAPEEGPEERLERTDEAARIRRILHTLPETYREVFMWRVYAELSFQQIGAVFGKSQNWACVTYHRARKMILERMEAEEDER